MNRLALEEELYQKGFMLIAGVDEVGRGCIAGPVVASAVIMPKGFFLEEVRDSKKLSDKKRRALKVIIEENALSYATAFIDERVIDKINILEASKKAMIEAIQKLIIKPDFVLIDAIKIDIKQESMSIIKGDDLSFSIACASIIAKVNRDDYMIKLSEQFPQYGFAQNKGYPTKSHIEALNEQGITDCHRKSYRPITNILKMHNL